MKKGGVVGVLHRLHDTTNLRIGIESNYHPHGLEYKQSFLPLVNLLPILCKVIDINQEWLKFSYLFDFLCIYSIAYVFDAAQIAIAYCLVDGIDDPGPGK